MGSSEDVKRLNTDSGDTHTQKGLSVTDTVIIFTSTTGKTRKIAEYLAKNLDADKFDLKLQSNINLSDYSRVILGTGVHAGHAYGRLVNFVDNNANILLDKQVFLFLSCLYKGERAEKQCSDIAKEFHIHNAVFFSVRGEKNQAGLSTDVDAFIERMRN